MHIFIIHSQTKNTIRFGAAKFIFVEYKLVFHLVVGVFVERVRV